MPKTKEEKETLKEFGKEYKDPKKAKEVYYALRNKNKKFDRSQGGGFSDKADGFSIMIEDGEILFQNEDGEILFQNDGNIIITKAEHEGHLVSSEGKKHLPTSSNGKPNHRLMGAAWAALHGGYRGNKYEGPDKSSAISKLKRLYHREGMKPPSGKAIMEDDKSIKESRSEYPANEEGFTTSMGPADLSAFAAASRKSSPLWWVARLNKLPEAVKSKLMKSLNLAPAVTWWNERIETLTNHLGSEEDDKEDHTR